MLVFEISSHHSVLDDLREVGVERGLVTVCLSSERRRESAERLECGLAELSIGYEQAGRLKSVSALYASGVVAEDIAWVFVDVVAVVGAVLDSVCESFSRILSFGCVAHDLVF